MDFKSKVALQHALNSIMVIRQEVELYYQDEETRQELLSKITNLAYYIDNLRIKSTGENK
jgi:hypothetical protein